jgi:calcineurin-like phosphoesterase family protein
MNIWFTSDTHYGHTNIAGPEVSRWEKGYRNFENVWQMNDTLIKNINGCVKENDILYFLGDWSFGGVHNIYHFRNHILCKNIHFILGNHDKYIVNRDFKFYETSFNPFDLFLSVQDVLRTRIGKHNHFFLSHYSHQVWPSSHKGTMHLFGHSHGNIKPIGRSMDVGIDTHPEFRPYHLGEVLEILTNKEIF